MILLLSRTRLPRDRALLGAVLYGALGIGASYSLLYWGIQFMQASLLMVILSLGPLLTMFFAVAHGLEAFRWRGLAGALIAFAGIAVSVVAGIRQGHCLPRCLQSSAGAACMAEGSVVFKLLSGAKPLPANVVAFSVAACIQVVVALVAGETWMTPTAARTIAALAYLVVVGSVVLFYLYLFLLSRWTASATSYVFLLFPVATAPIAALVLGEHVTGQFMLGAAVALLGVWISALESRPRAVRCKRENNHGPTMRPSESRMRLTTAGRHACHHRRRTRLPAFEVCVYQRVGRGTLPVCVQCGYVPFARFTEWRV